MHWSTLLVYTPQARTSWLQERRANKWCPARQQGQGTLQSQTAQLNHNLPVLLYLVGCSKKAGTRHSGQTETPCISSCVVSQQVFLDWNIFALLRKTYIIYCIIGEGYQRWLSWFATQLGATLIFTQNVATLLHPINCHSTHGAWKIIISVSGPFWGIFSRGNILPFQDTVNWPSVMRLCCQFLGFLVQSGTMDLEQYENKSNKCLANPLYSVDAIPIAERYFSPCYWLLKSRIVHKTNPLLDRTLGSLNKVKR